MIPRITRRTAALAAVLTMLGTAALVAHDFWLVPETHRVPVGWALHVSGQTGMEFPESASAIAPDRVADARLVSAGEEVAVRRKARLGTSLVLEATPTGAGEWWVAVELRPRLITLTGEQFDEYLEHDGIWDVLERRRRAGTSEASVRERYTKYAKALVRAGEGGPPVHARPVGHPIEFVFPERSPFELHPGEEVAVRLLWRGEPLADHIVLAGREGAGEGPTAHTRTDENGVARFRAFVPGRWYAKAIQMERRDSDPELDYESYWATVTFRVAPAEGGGEG